jgi:hypothetical protein
VANCAKPESTLKKKHNAIAYHPVREAVAARTIGIAKEDGKTNIADLLTKLFFFGGGGGRDLKSYVLKCSTDVEIDN